MRDESRNEDWYSHKAPLQSPDGLALPLRAAIVIVTGRGCNEDDSNDRRRSGFRSTAGSVEIRWATTRELFGVSVDETPISRGRRTGRPQTHRSYRGGPFLRALGRRWLEAPRRATRNAGQDGHGGYEQRGECNNYS